MMSIVEIEDETLKFLDEKVFNYRSDLERRQKQETNEFIYVPSINLYVAKQTIDLEKNLLDSNKKLHSKNYKILTPLEFIEFLKEIKENHEYLYDEVIRGRNNLGAEFIDARFSLQKKNILMSYHVFDDEGKIVKKSEAINENALITNKSICLEDYLYNNHTPQGLPNKDVESGDIYYSGFVDTYIDKYGRFLGIEGNPKIINDLITFSCHNPCESYSSIVFHWENLGFQHARVRCAKKKE